MEAREIYEQRERIGTPPMTALFLFVGAVIHLDTHYYFVLQCTYLSHAVAHTAT